MTERVDFYVLNTATAQQRRRFACRLTEKAYLLDLRVVILNDSDADAEAMDDLLWTFNEHSFVPHALCRDESALDAATPVHLTADPEALGRADLLVNLSSRFPGHLERFVRIAEILDADEEVRRLGRDRFRSYRALKLPLETHRLNDAAET